MEFVPGETLQQRVDRKGPLEIGDAIRIGRQIAEGLAAAHATGLIHRDIKPSNVLIEASPQERVKITDFGLAQAADDASLTRSGVVAGTPMYMAPEQARGDSLDHRADLFSLGSVLYLMCTGRPPFRASTTFAVLKRVAEESPRPMREVIPEIPNWFCRIVEKLHAKNPDERYQIAREVADVLADCERQMQTHKVLKDFTRIPEGKPPAARWSHRRIRVTGVLLAIPLLLYITLWFIPSIVLTAQNRAVIHFDVIEADALLILSRNGKEYQTQIGPGTIKLLPGTYDVELRSLSGRVVSQLSYYQRTFLTGHFIPHHSPQLNEIYIGRGDILRLTASFGDRDSTPLPVAVPPASTNAKGWIQLFNGKDLTGWKTHPKQPGNWRVENGILMGTLLNGNVNHLFTERDDYRDFHMRAEVQIDQTGNSGIYFRSPFELRFLGGKFPPAYEVAIYNNDGTSSFDAFKTGSIHGLKLYPQVLIKKPTGSLSTSKCETGTPR